ncbi:MAG: T9SS type A sorting domain-containing protein [Candidatus Cloacimonetes bacterium]|nr:T9SS type A sorting domain-containing protein [Candidatus Cloacimonadota bacterium]MBS3767064.1 T9SS type A sorting domain-containing protein [Candidatus Cloacimonadota bacterium]
MKFKYLKIILALFIGCCFLNSTDVSFAADTNIQNRLQNLQEKLYKLNQNVKNYDRYSNFYENFEDGAQNWTEIDETTGEAYWHTDTTHSYEGKSWWVGDPDVGSRGGYLNNWYQVLDTPEIELPQQGNLNLSFKQFRAYEPPDNYNYFNGWDGFNVRIRKAGESYRDAEILTDVDPSYNCSSLYSFGYIHAEDPDGIPGIPGWGGFSNGWIETNFTIPEAYRGENVIISFAFASDGAACTVAQSDNQEDHPNWTGVFIDNINVADVFTNNGEDPTGFDAYRPSGGQLWHVYESDNAPSPVHAMGCFDENTGTYNPFMDDFIVTPEINLPANADIWWDTKIKVELDDPTNFPDCDYIKVQVRYKEDGEWQAWNSISNPSGDPGGDNYVFTGEAPDWVLFSQGFPGYNDITVLAGKIVQFRIGLTTNRDTPTTFGVRIDNFSVEAIPHYNAPRDFSSSFNTISRNVELEWAEPFGIVPEELIYNKPDSIISYINDGQPYAIKVTNPYDYPVPLNSINFMLYSGLTPPQIIGDVDVIAWENNGGIPGDTLLVKNDIADLPHYAYKDVDVSNYGIVIPAEESIFVGINNFEMENQGLLADNAMDQGHSYCFAFGGWYPVSEVYPDLSNITITATIQKKTPETSPIGYNIYRSQDINAIDNLIASVSNTNYIDENLEIGQYFYLISALYEDGESEVAGPAWSYVELPTAKEIFYDNGNPEIGYSAGNSLDRLAVKITAPEDTVRLLRLKYYLTEVNSDILLQIWDISGNSGLPGESLLEEPLRVDKDVLLTNDWNIIDIPGQENIIFGSEQDVYIGWLETDNNSKIGLDDGSPPANRSFQYSNGEWNQYEQGNFMMRAIVDTLPTLAANFSADVTWGTVPFTVNFSDLSRPIDDPITSWVWDFGDGEFSESQNPNHEYDSVGVYNVLLTVSTDSKASDNHTKNDYIYAYPPIWSGDTNSDGVVDTLDINQIAVHMNKTGETRDNISFAWMRNEYPGGWTSQDAALADCNGDGIVNLADILGIGVNWQKTHTPVPGAKISSPNNLNQYRDEFLRIYNSLEGVANGSVMKEYLENILSLPQTSPNTLISCYPNPYNPTMHNLTIKYALEQNISKASIKIYNIKGQLVKSFNDISGEKSQEPILWNGRDNNKKLVGSGIYFYKLSAGEKAYEIKKFIVIR